MVDFEGLENNSFSIVEIDKKQIRITGYKRATNSELHY
jgi:alkaline phosphatase